MFLLLLLLGFRSQVFNFPFSVTECFTVKHYNKKAPWHLAAALMDSIYFFTIVTIKVRRLNIRRPSMIVLSLLLRVWKWWSFGGVCVVVCLVEFCSIVLEWIIVVVWLSFFGIWMVYLRHIDHIVAAYMDTWHLYWSNTFVLCVFGIVLSCIFGLVMKVAVFKFFLVDAFGLVSRHFVVVVVVDL